MSSDIHKEIRELERKARKADRMFFAFLFGTLVFWVVLSKYELAVSNRINELLEKGAVQRGVAYFDDTGKFHWVEE